MLNQPKTDMARRLRNRLNQPGILVLPGMFNAAVAKLVEAAGFEGGYITGAGLANGLTGYPDIGMLDMSEVVRVAGYMADAVDIPLICDADTGYGEALQVMRTVQQFEQAGIAGIHIEDQGAPKRCGHLEGKQLVSIEAMQAKMTAACSARQDPDFLVIARVDARGVTSMADAIVRATAYHEAGADMIFVEALTSREEFADFACAMKGEIPLMANMTEFGKTPYLSTLDFEALGYQVVIFPMMAFRVMMKAVQEALTVLKVAGTQSSLLDRMQTRAELYQLLGYSAYEALDRQWAEQATLKTKFVS
jgi:methylisocitrate lyase